MHVQKLVSENAPEYRSLMLRAYEMHPDSFTSSAIERSQETMQWWQSRLEADADARSVVFGAWVDGKMSGAAGISFFKREKLRHKSSIFGVYVNEEHRGTGIGTQLLRALLNEARGRVEVQIVQLTVTEENLAAQRMYTSAGFVQFGVEPLAIRVGSTFFSKIHMWRSL